MLTADDINDADADERAVKRCEREVAECGKRERGMPEILANFNNNNNNINNNNNSNNNNNKHIKITVIYTVSNRLQIILDTFLLSFRLKSFRFFSGPR